MVTNIVLVCHTQCFVCVHISLLVMSEIKLCCCVSYVHSIHFSPMITNDYIIHLTKRKKNLW